MSSCGAPQPTSSSAESERLRTSTACRARSYRLRGSSGLPTNRRKRLSTGRPRWRDRKSTRLNSSHSQNSDAVFCLKKKVADRRGALADVPTAARHPQPVYHLPCLPEHRPRRYVPPAPPAAASPTLYPCRHELTPRD